MDGLSRSFGPILALCLLLFVVALGIGVVYELSSRSVEKNEETPAFPTGEKVEMQEIQESEEEHPHFEWVGHSILSDGRISIQLKYVGPTIHPFSRDKVDFLINGKVCRWGGMLLKEDGSRIVSVDRGEKIYILLNLGCDFKKGDTLTFWYRPLNLRVSAQL